MSENTKWTEMAMEMGKQIEAGFGGASNLTLGFFFLSQIDTRELDKIVWIFQMCSQTRT